MEKIAGEPYIVLVVEKDLRRKKTMSEEYGFSTDRRYHIGVSMEKFDNLLKVYRWRRKEME